jgi:hypothetical protein
MNCDQPALLRHETPLTLKAIAARMHLGTSKSANARLHEWTKSFPPSKSSPCAART